MSGSSAYYPAPTQLGTLPSPEQGSKQVAVKIDWASTSNYTSTINLLSQFNTGQFTTIQSVFVDNTTCPFPLSLTAGDSGFRISVPAFCYGTFPLICEQAPVFTVSIPPKVVVTTATLPPGTTRLYFLNTPEKPFLLPNFVNQIGTISAGFGTLGGVTTQTLYTPTADQISAGLHVAITSLHIQFYLPSGVTLGAAGLAQIAIQETSPPRTIWETAVPPGTGPLMVTDIIQTFDDPLIAWTNSTPLILILLNASVSGGSALGAWCVNARYMSII